MWVGACGWLDGNSKVRPAYLTITQRKSNLMPRIIWIFSPCQENVGCVNHLSLKCHYNTSIFIVCFLYQSLKLMDTSFQEENEVQRLMIIPHTNKDAEIQMVSYLKEYGRSAPKFKYLSRHLGSQHCQVLCKIMCQVQWGYTIKRYRSIFGLRIKRG